jgi:hypothetical protein
LGLTEFAQVDFGEMGQPKEGFIGRMEDGGRRAKGIQQSPLVLNGQAAAV